MEHPKDAGFLIKVIHDTIATKANACFREYDLTLAQARVLGYLAKSGGQVPLGELERYFRVKHPTMIGILRRLETKEFVSTSINAHDKRARDICLLPKGAELHDQLREMIRAEEAKLTEGFSEQEKSTLLLYLVRAYKNIAP